MGRDYSSSDLDAFARLTDFGTDASRSRQPVKPAAPDERDSMVRYSSADLEQFQALSDPDAVNRRRPPARAERKAGSPFPRDSKPAPSKATAPAPDRSGRAARASGYNESDLRLFDGILARDLRKAASHQAPGQAQSPIVEANPRVEFTKSDLDEFDKLMMVSPDVLAHAEQRFRDDAGADPQPAARVDESKIVATMKIVEADTERHREHANFALGTGRMKIVFSDTGTR